MLDKQAKDKVVKKYKLHDHDTGSPEVQCAILSEEISQLTEHLKRNPKDHSSRRGLLGKVNQRRKLITYLKKEDPARAEALTKKLGLS